MAKNQPRANKCFVGGCDNPAPYGLRLPGSLRDLPADKRGYLWHCKGHASEAESRRDKAMGKST